jgi:hypothetical protein
MEKKTLGCGVAEHDTDCLCDVKISGEPWEVKVTIPYDYFAGEEICEMFGLGVPWTGADLATFLEKVGEVRSYFNRNNQIHRIPVVDPDVQLPRHGNAKFTHEQLADLKDWIRAGGKPTELKNRVFEEFGIRIHKSYVVKTRLRMQERGEF